MAERLLIAGYAWRLCNAGKGQQTTLEKKPSTPNRSAKLRTLREASSYDRNFCAMPFRFGEIDPAGLFLTVHVGLKERSQAIVRGVGSRKGAANYRVVGFLPGNGSFTPSPAFNSATSLKRINHKSLYC